jgi:hypothetical protein
MSKIRDLVKEFSHLKKGEQLTYHTGFIASDRLSRAIEGPRFAIAKSVGDIADHFYDLSTVGKAYLVQTKASDEMNHSHYIAIKR